MLYISIVFAQRRTTLLDDRLHKVSSSKRPHHNTYNSVTNVKQYLRAILNISDNFGAISSKEHRFFKIRVVFQISYLRNEVAKIS